MKVAAKLLTVSDLTLFRAQYDIHKGITKQKAINLNRSIFINEFFPALASENNKFRVGLSLFGPGRAPSLSTAHTATILRQKKNWRLDGRLIESPPDFPNRFDELAEGDIAVLGFFGTVVPSGVSILLVSAKFDSELHESLMRECELSTRTNSMKVLSPSLIDSLSEAEFGAPLDSFGTPDTVEDAVFNYSSVRTNGMGPAISQESVQDQFGVASQIGLLGEETFEAWLIHSGLESSDEQVERDFTWIANTHARAAYDFRLTATPWGDDACCVHVDVKSTKRDHAQAFHMSLAEVKFAALHPDYKVARLSALTEEFARICILGGVSELCSSILQGLENALPQEVTVDSFSISPARLSELHWEDFVPEIPD